MLVIRSEQMQAFSEQMLKRFEDRMAGYLAERFPDACAAKDEPAVRESIQKGIERSRSYGVTTEYDIARYIELMYLFSEDFDTSIKTPWARPILENPDLGSYVKMNELWERAAQDTHAS